MFKHLTKLRVILFFGVVYKYSYLKKMCRQGKKNYNIKSN